MGFGFRVWGKLGVEGLGVQVYVGVLGLKVSGLGFGCQGLGLGFGCLMGWRFGVSCFGSRVFGD